MTSFSRLKPRDVIAADEFGETHAFHRIERAFVRTETVFVLDGEIVLRKQGGCIETSDE